MSQHNHADNTQRFTGRAINYNLYRERYDPAILLPRLREWCGITSNWLVADIGAGTGMLSDVFLSNGNRVLAIEPNAEMREACIALHTNESRLDVIDGTAEATTLPARSVDLVACGRAFHWFNVDATMAECRRILKPGGWFVSVAFGRADNGRDENLAIEELLRSTTASGQSTRDAYAKYARLPEFLPHDYHNEQIDGSLHLTWTELLGLIHSLSHAPLPEDPRAPAFDQSLRDLFERFAVDDRITLATRYWINAGRL